uniref:Variant surface glycoprotein 718 n=1 Tax=Trypanosoma brucei TaxID=5691 RepID=M4SU82_9TRYP|nr:variant surface glycoprotein 718 [Trypanosoma brucei]
MNPSPNKGYILIFWLALVVPTQAARTAKHAALTQPFVKLCTLIGELKMTHEYVNDKLKQQAELTSKLEILVDQLDIYSRTTADPAEARLATALTGSARRATAQAGETEVTLARLGLTLAIRAGVVAGQATEFFEIMDQVTGDNPTAGGCLIDAGSGTAVSSYTGLKTKLVGCQSQAIPEATAGNAKQTAKPDFDAVTAEADISDPGSYTQANCFLLADPDSSGTGPAGVNARHNKLLYAAGAIQLDGTPLLQVKALKDTASEPTLSRYNELKQAQAAFDQIVLTDPTTADKVLYEFIMQDQTFLKAAAAVISNANKTGAQVLGDTNIMNQIRAKIGKNDAAFTANYLKTICGITIADNNEWGIKLTDKKLSGLTNTEEYAHLLTFFALTSQTQPENKECDSQVHVTTAEKVCNAIEKEQECNHTKDCHYDSKKDGKKCTLKKTVKEKLENESQEKGGKDGKNESKCGEAKIEDECKKVPGKIPEGKKAVCGWIEGKCKDSSVLVN